MQNAEKGIHIIGTSSDSHQLRPFSNWELLLKSGSEFCPLRAFGILLVWNITFTTLGDLP